MADVELTLVVESLEDAMAVADDIRVQGYISYTNADGMAVNINVWDVTVRAEESP